MSSHKDHNFAFRIREEGFRNTIHKRKRNIILKSFQNNNPFWLIVFP